MSSLPDDIALSILARISRSNYPKLSLVSKSFRSITLSDELSWERVHLGTLERCLYVCLQSVDHPYNRSWFSLWIKPEDHQARTTENKTTRNWLLPVPSSYTSFLPIISRERIGSETYEFLGEYTPSYSSDLWVYNEVTHKGCKTPSMTIARKNVHMCSYDGKLYVIGGCEPNISTNWAEVFDPKIQTWEPLPDPGPMIRCSIVRSIAARQGRIDVKTNKKDCFYLIKERRWELYEKNLYETYTIDNVCYRCDGKECYWYDSGCAKWKLVKGLSGLEQHFMIDTTIGGYCGKLVMVWIGPARYPLFYRRQIWCAVILLEKRDDGEIWGQIEWVDHVLTAPTGKYTLWRCVEVLQ